jgi:hypothetical protein
MKRETIAQIVDDPTVSPPAFASCLPGTDATMSRHQLHHATGHDRAKKCLISQVSVSAAWNNLLWCLRNSRERTVPKNPQISDWSYAWPEAVDLGNVAFLSTRRPEAFATAAARDKRLGRFGLYEVVAAPWAEVAARGFQIEELACGHALGEPGFDTIAPPLVDAIAQEVAKTMDRLGTVIISRVCYEIHFARCGTPIFAHPAIGFRADTTLMEATMDWLQSQLANRLHK